MVSNEELDQVIDGYVDALLWSNNLNDFDNGTENAYGEFGDFADSILGEYNPDLLERAAEKLRGTPSIVERCRAFTAEHETVLRDLIDSGQCPGWSHHGHDLLLTMQHNGVGFWDRNYGKAGDELTEAAQKAGPEGVSLWTIPEDGSVAAATDIGYEEN